MAVITLSAAVDLSKVKMKWKETYVSEGMNHKIIPSTPKGIYRGLHLTQNITSHRLVDVTAGASERHEAVHQSADGFSMTYFDDVGVTTTLDLSSASLDNTETVIVLSIVYEIGVDTTAHWLAYPIADWNALSSATQGEFIILGTVNVPASATNITTSMILPKRRTVSWENAASGATPWSAIIKNPGFEHGVTAGDAVKYSISDWVNRTDLATNGSFRLGTATVRSGAKSLELHMASHGPTTAKIEQHQEVPVIAGQLFHIAGWIKQIQSITAGTCTFNINWGDLDSNPLSLLTTTITASISSGTDSSFRFVDLIAAVPTGANVLKSVSIEASGITWPISAPSSGVTLAIDDFQVYVETGSPQALQSAINSRLKQQMVSALIAEDPATYVLGQIAALLRFDKTNPNTSEGQFVVERKDQDYTGGKLPPALKLLGRMLSLGSGLVSTEADNHKARVSAPLPPIASGFSYTLLWESIPTDLSYMGSRIYAKSGGGFMFTVNAYWDGTNWNKDSVGIGTPAMSFSISSGAFVVGYQVGATDAWVDAWLNPYILTPSIGEILAPLFVSGTSIDLVTPLLTLSAGNTPLRAGKIFDALGMDGNGGTAITPFGGIQRKGSFLFDDFMGAAIDLNKWSESGGGTTAINFDVGPAYSMTTLTSAASTQEIDSRGYTVYVKNFPRCSARLRTNKLNPANILGNAAKVIFGFNNLYLNYDQSFSTNKTHWRLHADGVDYDTGLVSNLDGVNGFSSSQIVYIAVTSSTTVVVAIHDQNDTWSSANIATITVPALSLSSRDILAAITNTTGHNPAPTLYVDFIEAYECSRLD